MSQAALLKKQEINFEKNVAKKHLFPIIDNTKKETFLTKLKSKGGRFRYSRYKGLPLRYAGGKSLAVGYIIEHLPKHITRLASPFIGGGSVEIACANELNIKVFAYDLFDILTTYWQQQLAAPKQLAKKIANWQPNDKTYRQLKETLKKHWEKTEPITNDLELAAYYWFNHNLSYGPGFLGWMSKIYEDKNRFERLVKKVHDFHCPNLKVQQGSFEKIIPKHNGDFLYCDPPYFLDGNSKMFKGIYPQRNFPIHHNGFNHRALCDLLKKHKGGFILSYNDCQTIRDWYADFKIIEVEWQYTMGQGETRIGKNRIENGTQTHVKKSHELLIVNYG